MATVGRRLRLNRPGRRREPVAANAAATFSPPSNYGRRRRLNCRSRHPCRRSQPRWPRIRELAGRQPQRSGCPLSRYAPRTTTAAMQARRTRFAAKFLPLLTPTIATPIAEGANPPSAAGGSPLMPSSYRIHRPPTPIRDTRSQALRGSTARSPRRPAGQTRTRGIEQQLTGPEIGQPAMSALDRAIIQAYRRPASRPGATIEPPAAVPPAAMGPAVPLSQALAELAATSTRSATPPLALYTETKGVVSLPLAAESTAAPIGLSIAALLDRATQAAAKQETSAAARMSETTVTANEAPLRPLRCATRRRRPPMPLWSRPRRPGVRCCR